MKYKRKKLNLQVKRRFQMWLLVRIMGTIIVSSIVAAVVLYFYAHQEVGKSFYEAHIKIRRVSDLLVPVVIAGSLVSLVSGMLIAIFLPQKIAGPVFRIEADLEKIRAGDSAKKISLRESDPLHGLAASINRTIDYLRGK